MTRFIAQQLALEFKPEMYQTLRAQVADPSQAGQMEAQLAIWWAAADLHYGGRRGEIIRALARVTPEGVSETARRYLVQKNQTALLLAPEPKQE